MKLNVKAFAIAMGVTWGLIILIVTFILTLRGSGGEHLSRLGLFYLGYTVTYGGEHHRVPLELRLRSDRRGRLRLAL